MKNVEFAEILNRVKENDPSLTEITMSCDDFEVQEAITRIVNGWGYNYDTNSTDIAYYKLCVQAIQTEPEFLQSTNLFTDNHIIELAEALKDNDQVKQLICM